MNSFTKLHAKIHIHLRLSQVLSITKLAIYRYTSINILTLMYVKLNKPCSKIKIDTLTKSYAKIHIHL